MASRPYEGFPYSNPHVHDVPTIDAATASRWNNLPRRPIQPPRGNVVYVDLPEEGSQVSRPNDTQTDKKDPEPMIYIEVPDSSDAGLEASLSEPDYSAQCRRPNSPSGKKSDEEPDPVIYIDVPGSSSSGVAGPASDHPDVHYYSRPNDTSTSSYKEDPEPRIFIDVPDSSDNDVAGPASPEPEPEYVQETIFYDPFENRRIDRQKTPDETQSPSGSGTGPRRPAPQPPRPTPPNTLDLHGAGSSGYSTFSSPSSTPRDFSSRELYHDDRFSPLPVSHYPEPPPAYCEIHMPHTPQAPSMQTPHTPPESPPSSQEPPRTIVITHGAGELNQPSGELPSPIGLASPDRKVVYCHHCGQRVHTLVIRESGPVTHAIAIALFFLMLIPIIVLVYCTNACKYRNHYCPNCNKKIGYEFPALCISMTYTM